MSNQDNSKPTDHKKGLSRREFIKLGAAATTAVTAFGVSGHIARAAAEGTLKAPFVLQGAKKEITLKTWFWTEPGRSDAWRAMIKKFHDSQSDIHINEAGSGENNYFTQILVEAKSGKIEGDMYTATPDVFLRLSRDGHTVSLEDAVKSSGSTPVKAQDMLRKDGALHGLDIVTVAFGLLYNKGLYDKASLGEPTSLENWVEGAKALTDKSKNQYGIFSPHVASDPFTTWFTLQQWPVLYDGVWAKGQTPLINSEQVINGMKLFKSMFEYMPQGTAASESNKMFGASQIAQMLVVSAAVNEWKSSATDPNMYGNLRSAKPFWPGGKGITRIHPICINAHADTANQDAAEVFIGWLYKKENYRELLERCLDVIPAIEDGIDPAYRATLTWADGYDATKTLTVPETLGDFVFYNDELGQIVVPHFQDIITGTATAEDAMNAAQTEAEALAKRVFS